MTVQAMETARLTSHMSMLNRHSSRQGASDHLQLYLSKISSKSLSSDYKFIPFPTEKGNMSVWA